MMKKHRSTLLAILLHLVLKNVYVRCSFSDVTSDVFGKQHNDMIIAAFGDLDADKATDIFALSSDGKSLYILEADIDIRRDGTEFRKKTFLEGKSDDSTIVSVVPGDFNRDSQMDVLVMRKADKDDSSTKVKITIYDGKTEKASLIMNETFRDQPVVIDGNGDMAPDLFGETSDGKRALWTFSANFSSSIHYYEDGLSPLKIPQSSAFLDLNGDLTADLCAVSVKDKEVSFEFWINKNGNLTKTKNVKAPPELKVVGQASFVDMNGNHEINIVLPGCLDDECKESAIYVWAHNTSSKEAAEGIWHKLDVNFKVYSKTTSFPKEMKPVSWLSIPIALRMGDYNLDGYPDAIAVFTDSDDGSENVSAFLLENKGYRGGSDGFSRTLSIDYGQTLHKNTPALATFFDLKENGVLDILLTEVKDGKTSIRAIKQDFTGDASFLKVMVVSGLCRDDCPKGHSPYGVNQVGPTAKFMSTTPTGDEQIGVASQLTQSAYFSLQLPFMLFGLGQTPNFVDDLQVGIPYPAGKKPRHHSWATIIPNSQVIVIPYPVSEPGSWKHELYVTPSRLVLLTGASLLGTCGFIAVIVGLLQWRERMEDKREKLQEAQRFHFDAM